MSRESTCAQVETCGLAQAKQVPSDLPFKNDHLRERKRKSLAACADASQVPLSKREREEEGELTPSPLSLLSYSLPQTPAKRAASLAGLIARWCDLTGNVPDVTKGETHAGKFSAHLDQLAAEKRRIESIAF